MRTIKKMTLLGVLFLGLSSCATIFDNMEINCDDNREAIETCSDRDWNIQCEEN